MWELHFTNQAQKDARKLASSGLKPKAQELLEILRKDPFSNPPPYETLIGELSGAYSRRKRMPLKCFGYGRITNDGYSNKLHATSRVGA